MGSARVLPPRRNIARALLMLVLAPALWVAPAHADYNDPRTMADCNIHSGDYHFASRKAELDRSIQRCLRTASGANWIRIPVCGYPGSRDCAALEQQRCELDNTMNAIRNACVSRLRLHNMREAERERREKERQQQEARAREEQAALMRGASARMVTPGGVSPALAPATQAQRGAMIGGLAAARAAGVPVLRYGGALHLSNAFTLEGTRVVQSIQQQTLAMLDASMTSIEAEQHQRRTASASAPYSRRNPYPLESQVRQQSDDAFRQAARTATMEGRLPFGNESAVVGDRAEHLTELAEARASGELRQPFWSMDVGEALVAPRSDNPSAPVRESGPDDPALRRQRMTALAQVQMGRVALQRQQEAAAERKRAVEPRRNQDKQTSPAGKKLNPNILIKHCVDRQDRTWRCPRNPPPHICINAYKIWVCQNLP